MRRAKRDGRSVGAEAGATGQDASADVTTRSRDPQVKLEQKGLGGYLLDFASVGTFLERGQVRVRV